MPRLYVLSGAHIGATHDFTDAVEVGRAVENGLTLKGGSISRRHARFEQVDGRWFVVDLGSSNGVFVGGERVRRAAVEDGEPFKLGDIEVRLRYDAAPDASSQPAAALQQQPVQSAPVVAPQPEPEPEAPAEEEEEEELEISFPNQPEPPPVAAASDDFDLEGDWDDSVPAPTAPTAPAQPQKPAPPSRSRPAQSEAQKKTREQASARAQSLGGGAVAGSAKTASGGRVLQFNRVEQRTGVFATDLSQHPTWVRFMAYALVIAVFGGMVYGSFKLFTGLRDRGQHNVVEDY